MFLPIIQYHRHQIKAVEWTQQIQITQIVQRQRLAQIEVIFSIKIFELAHMLILPTITKMLRKQDEMVHYHQIFDLISIINLTHCKELKRPINRLI